MQGLELRMRARKQDPSVACSGGVEGNSQVGRGREEQNKTCQVRAGGDCSCGVWTEAHPNCLPRLSKRMEPYLHACTRTILTSCYPYR